MLNFINSLLDYIFYKRCYFCRGKSEKGIICNNCRKKIITRGSKKRRKIAKISVESWFFYENEIKKLIRGIKYHDKRQFAEEISEIIIKLAGEREFFNKNVEIIPVPLFYERQKERKYNHMELIAQEISNITGCKTNIDLLKRIKHTRVMYNLSGIERKENIRGAFRVFPEFYSGKKLVLLDDISTTGATLTEIISELRKNNINNISGFVIAFAGNHGQ